MKLTVTEFAARHGRTRQHILKLLATKRIPGAVKIGNGTGLRGMWLIPEHSQVIDLPAKTDKTK